ncbi:flagellar biosynthetic protein FliR [Nitrospira moscoviensis]|uniref:Flagellar biosynthetic protein FliR n=1 Tax=Nitrospira moscoviensis TaxID=42253 RepID=A0A0K2GCD9_NITMO|nr:flagellar biosynthetic protein FliR [Nitrospira moscoviensis]ALA58613.1 Flagellar biosynthetic protein fliR [Nitrospira moscoviensis]
MALAHTIQIALPEFEAFLVLVSRIGGLLAALPVLSGRTVPMKVKIALVLVLGAALAPVIHLPAVSHDPLLLAAGLVGEMAIGLTIGLAVRLFFGALELAGEMIGVQMGFGVVQLFDPATAHQTPLVGQYFTLLASLVFLSLNAHMLAVATIVSSYEAIPAFGASLPSALGDDVVHLSQQMFTLGLKLAAPVLITILLLNILLAMLGRAVSQINVFVLSFPITIAGGLIVMGLAMPFTVSLLAGEIERLQMAIEALMKVLGHG